MKVLLESIQALGHEVAVSCVTGCTGTTLVWHGIKCFPDSGHITQHGTDMVKTHAKQWGADIVISWIDAFAIPPDVAAKHKWFAWVPVDSEPLMVRNVPTLKSCKWMAAPTKWGQRMLKEAGFPDALHIPCSHNPKDYHVIPGGLAEAKRELGKVIKRDLAGKFLVNVVSANCSGRKNFQAIFHAWKLFHDMYENSLLYLHTDITGYFQGGNDLVEMAKTYGVKDDSVFYVSQWEYNSGQIDEKYLNLVFNASDVHLNCCYGEGFGLPIMDAQAAGCPTIVPAFAAAKETGMCHKVTDGMMYATLPGAIQLMVNPEAVADALASVYNQQDNVDRQEISEATKHYQVQHVVEEYWKPVLKMIEGSL